MSLKVTEAELIHLRQVQLAAQRLVRSIERNFSRRGLEPIERDYGLLAKILGEGSPHDPSGSVT